LPRAQLRRREVRITNLIPVHPYINRNPTKDEIAFFEHILLDEIAKTKPRIIVPMGAFASKYFLGPVDMATVHGLPFKSKTHDCTILPSFHPAAGLYSTDTQPQIVYDFEQVSLAIQGKLPDRQLDLYPDPAYIELTTYKEVRQSLDGSGALLMGLDTEGYKGTPWGLSYSISEGVAYVIRAASKEALQAFADWIREHPECLIILHNALHDLPILREMGVHVKNFEDTMVYAYALCVEPQGLKDLSFRHCGMKMKSYEDVTGPAMRKLTAEYLIKVASGDWGLDPQVPERESDQVVRYRQPQALHKRALRVVNDTFGFYTGTIIGPRNGGSAKLDEIGVRVGKVDHETVVRLGLRTETVVRGKKPNKVTGLVREKIVATQTENAWHAEVPITVMQTLDQFWGEFIWELQPPIAPDSPPDPLDRWKVMSKELEESVERCEKAIGWLPEVGLDAVVNQQEAIDYSACDARATLAMRKQVRAKIDAAGLSKLTNLDMSVLPYLDRMASTGVKVNRKHMLDYGAQLKIEMRQIQEKIEKDLGVWINPSSPPQVAMVIYDLLGFPVEHKTETGQPSTNDKVLEALAPLNKSITDITDFRELHKLRSTYALKLPRWTDEHDRVHPTWKYTRVASGRLSTADPNLLGIPVRSERGNVIRAGFIPEPGHCFVGCDLSQIEVRVAAHFSQDPNLIKIFTTKGADFHTKTAAYMWKLSEAEIMADAKALGGASKRASGKNVSFGVLYGIGAKGLQAQLKSKCHTDWSEEQCQEMIDLWLETAYPHVKYYMERQKYLCRQKGYVESMFGRRRYLPGVHSTVPRIRAECERAAINHPIQSTAAEILKIAEADIWNRVLPRFWAQGFYVDVEPILAVHDELILECDLDIAQEVQVAVISAMENAVQLCVPVVSEGHISKSGADGGSWADLK
jgi:DNA polymerase I-like protein with 3'-5' exonuclease and polymerase domains